MSGAQGSGGYGGQQYGYGGGGYGGGGYGGGMPQQPAWGQGAGGQYSPMLRNAQNQWQQQAGYGGQQPPMWHTGVLGEAMPANTTPPDATATPPAPLQDMVANPAMNQPAAWQQAQWAANPRQPYGMGRMGMGNAYGYGRQPPMQYWNQGGNPWGAMSQGGIQGMRMQQYYNDAVQ